MNTETTSTLTPEPAQPISPVTTLIGLFIEPGKAFASIEKKSMIWLPLILSMLGGAALLFFYYQQVDFAWLQDKLIAGKEMDPAQREAALKFMSKNTLVIMSLIGALIGPPIVYAITALYYLMVAKRVYVNTPRSNEPIAVSNSMRLLMTIAIFGIIVIGIFPGPFLNTAITAVKGMYLSHL